MWEAGARGLGAPELLLLGTHNLPLIPPTFPANALIWYSPPFTSSSLFFIQCTVVCSTANYFHIFLKWVTSPPNFLMSVEPRVHDILDDTFR